MSKIVIGNVTLDASTIVADVIARLSIEDPSFVSFLANHDMKDVIKECAANAVKTLIEAGIVQPVAHISDYYKNKRSIFTEGEVIAMVRTESFKYGMAIVMEPSGRIIFPAEEMGGKAAVEKLRNQLKVELGKQLLMSIMRILGFTLDIVRTVDGVDGIFVGGTKKEVTE